MLYNDLTSLCERINGNIYNIPIETINIFIADNIELARELDKLNDMRKLGVQNPKPREREFLDLIDGNSAYKIEYGTNLFGDCYKISKPNT